MLDDIKISFVAIVDNKNQQKKELIERIWEHEKFVRNLLKKEVCIMGRKTHEITNWKGDKSWVLTRNKKWKRSGVGTIHSIDDIHLFCDTDYIYVLGGSSLYESFADVVDEIHLFVVNNKKGDEDWIEFDMKDWKPIDYKSNKVWSYARLEKKERSRKKDKRD